jgi:hypothetical protein
MNKNILKFIALSLVWAGSFFSCKDDSDIDMSKIDFSNIEDLYAQPLPVIEKCVEGKWKWISFTTWGVVGIWYPTNTFVDIMHDRVVVTGDDNLNEAFSFSYTWTRKKTTAEYLDYTTYVMWNQDRDCSQWFFAQIRNDTLAVIFDINVSGYNCSCLLLRIN